MLWHRQNVLITTSAYPCMLHLMTKTHKNKQNKQISQDDIRKTTFRYFDTVNLNLFGSMWRTHS